MLQSSLSAQAVFYRAARGVCGLRALHQIVLALKLSSIYHHYLYKNVFRAYVSSEEAMIYTYKRQQLCQKGFQI